MLLESNYKKFGLVPLDASSAEAVGAYKQYIKILYLPPGFTLTVDFKQFVTETSSLFFINSNQYLHIEKTPDTPGVFIYYNRDFYCVQIHDHEVACDGLLFNNIFCMPMTALPDKEDAQTRDALLQIQTELAGSEPTREEMIRTYLKQMIIRATRLWKQQQLSEAVPLEDAGFFRDFSRLVEIHFREKHSVGDYADLLALTPKALSRRLSRLKHIQPNEVIKDRILLEAKRLLAYSSMSIKEIAYDLGYDDPAYFNRLFNNKVGYTPAAYRKQFSVLEHP